MISTPDPRWLEYERLKRIPTSQTNAKQRSRLLELERLLEVKTGVESSTQH